VGSALRSVKKSVFGASFRSYVNISTRGHDCSLLNLTDDNNRTAMDEAAEVRSPKRTSTPYHQSLWEVDCEKRAE
jgi:hypothetical protein